MFRKITLIALWAALAVVLWGSVVQVSSSVLACPDWPSCFGKIVVSNDLEFRTYAAAEFPASRFNISKIWITLIHRYLAVLVGLMIVLLACFSYTQKQCRWSVIFTTTLLLLMIASQFAVNQWVVATNAIPLLVSSQALLGFFIFWLLYWLYLRVHPAVVQQQSNHFWLGLLTRLAVIVLLVQIFLGIWVSENSAALACTDFPRCNNQWLPSVDYVTAFNLFAGLESNDPSILFTAERIAVHWVHRVWAGINFLLLTAVILIATSEHYVRPVRKAGLLLSILLMVEISLGIMIIRFGAPSGLAIAHNGLAALLMLPLIAISFYSRYTHADKQRRERKKTTVLTAPAVADKAAQASEQEPTAESLSARLKAQLSKTRTSVADVLASLSLTNKSIDAGLLEQLETRLLMADIGVESTAAIIAQLTERLANNQLNDSESLTLALKQSLLEIVQPGCQPLTIPNQATPFVILVVGVNGAGKTTTIGKLAKHLQARGHSVMLAAGDTFRAAAVEQLTSWGERNNVPVVAQHDGADAAAVIYDAMQSATAKGIDVLLADTAGRLHTQHNLMEELSKIKRIISKADETAPHEVLLVLDAGTGQNAVAQTKLFNESVALTGLALTKLDGTAKGGVIFCLAKQFGLPIRFIGVGESIDDLQVFDAKTFVDALFATDQDAQI